MTISRKFLIATFVLFVMLVAFAAWAWFGGRSDRPWSATEGLNPTLVASEPRIVPVFGLASPIGWPAGATPTPAAGLTVTRFAAGLDHPRTMLTLPNGDVLVAETNAPPLGHSAGMADHIRALVQRHVGAGDPSPNAIVLLRDGDSDGRAEQRYAFRTRDLASPSGMAYAAGILYVANHDAVLAFRFTPGSTRLIGSPRKVMNLPAGGEHWMRNLLLSPDGRKLYVAVGSSSNIADNGMDAERGRAAIDEIDVASGSSREFAAGMRNPNGMAWNPSTGELWTTVNERDMLGGDLVPDYLTNVPVGAQYGWPWVYWKDHVDDRVKAPMPAYMDDYTRKPEYALGAHAAALGLLFADGGERMGAAFTNGAFIARHGSWNRKPLVGYDVVFVRFDGNGNPVGKPREVLAGFLGKDGKDAHGRPVWLAWDRQGGLLVSDDTGGIIWRVAAPGALPSPAPASVVTAHMRPQMELKGGPDAVAQASWAAATSK